MTHTVVLGGGICGLAAGFSLAEHGERVTLIEAQHFLGGLATTLRGETGAGFDFGPHAYHARNERVLNMFKDIASDGFPARAKNVRIKFRGKYYKYPLEAFDIAKSMSPILAARAFADYSIESLRRRLRPRALVSAEDWVVQAMGRTLYSLFFGPYTTKVWGVPPSTHPWSSSSSTRRVAPGSSPNAWPSGSWVRRRRTRSARARSSPASTPRAAASSRCATARSRPRSGTASSRSSRRVPRSVGARTRTSRARSSASRATGLRARSRCRRSSISWGTQRRMTRRRRRSSSGSGRSRSWDFA
ncbi:MAG: FAD-dependent oxidoreductase [Chloroflexi bacterium]|nr:MAG: FAD-dependent oxidoreductase [Chloroflexota bacterium]